MKDTYIRLMEKSLAAYTDEHIARYFKDVKANGLTEHGFPRLTADIGILIAHNRRRDLLPVFLEMMEFCCQTIPNVKAANDFSVREMVCCLLEVEQSGVISEADAKRWRGYLASIEPTKCYSRFATSPTQDVRNWALFTAVSEYFRQCAGLGGSSAFIDLQLGVQLRFLDENGMYRDYRGSEIHHPITYDLVPRGLFALLLSRGYRGKYYDEIDACLKKAGLLTLQMQSPNGEMAFGGRSNQFLHNEPWMMAVYEYEANRYAKEGNSALAAAFKAAIARALQVTETWLSKSPIRHIKNRFPTETKYGCEGYAYFDKYMITTASNLYAAYLICDDAIPTVSAPDHQPCAAATSEHFHKFFLKSGGYGLEFELHADPHYDANGLGRIHREGAPAAICLSCPCPASPSYTVDVSSPMAFSACSAIRTADGWRFGAEETAKYEISETGTDDASASATLICHLDAAQYTRERYSVSERGVSVTVEGDGEIAFALPAFCFDGEKSPAIVAEQHALSVRYEGWVCRYTTDGKVADLDRTAANRNGHYRVFAAIAKNELHVHIEIVKE